MDISLSSRGMYFLLCVGGDGAADVFRYIYISLRERGCNPVSESFLLRMLQEMTSNFVKAPGDTVKAFDRHGSRKSRLNFRVIFHVCFTPDTFLFVSHLPRNDVSLYS